MTVQCSEVGDIVRRAAMDQLVSDAYRHQDQFVLELGAGEWEFNPYAVAEWAWGLLERQREALTAAVVRAIEGDDNDNDNEETA